MCGITGYLTTEGDPVQKQLDQMGATLSHRGPDDAGTFHHAPETGDTVGGLAHRRLSVIDPTDAGHQPMADEAEEFWISYNGEVYNFEALREDLEAEGYTFTSETDTEVVLKGYDAWGRDLLPKLNGMFAFAILDLRSEDPELFLARDRMGQKPLYYSRSPGRFAFASEMKALLDLPWIDRTLDLDALNEYLTFLWVPEPRTIVEGVEKLPPGHWMRVSDDGVEVERYWKYEKQEEFDADEEKLARELRERLGRAFRRTTRADVPVSAFLSGGLDSSAIVSILERDDFPLHKVYTAAITPEDREYEGMPEDARYAEQLADDLDLDQELIVLEPDLADLLPQLVWHLDEPLADPAIMPLHCISSRAQKDTKVLLSGMGADELFGGYRRHAAAGILSVLHRIPGSGTLGKATSVLPSAGNHPLAPTFRRIARVGDALSADDPYIGVASWTTERERERLFDDRVLAQVEPSQAGERIRQALADVEDSPLIERMLMGDSRVYLPSHNLNYTDKISMGNGVEVRCPYLDNEILDFAARIPPRYKVRGGELKALLKRSLDGDLPDEILDRGKTGFGAPIRSWLDGPLDELVDEVLSPSRIEDRGLFSPEEVERMRDALKAGRRDTSYALWALLILELWLEEFDIKVPA